MNDLMTYKNLYGLNFYLGNKFHNFEQTLPANGYLFCTSKDFEKIQKNYEATYIFEPLTSTPNIIADVRDKIILCSFIKN
ncbi:MAG: dolichyl-phosphate-mannose--protein mannosyltransferase, partial [Parabacteroides sp.]|nr:dolichyl-phosphate-mannose--protein mannosyltransferase [Parabacteroides sp.]